MMIEYGRLRFFLQTHCCSLNDNIQVLLIRFEYIAAVYYVACRGLITSISNAIMFFEKLIRFHIKHKNRQSFSSLFYFRIKRYQALVDGA